MNLRAELAAWNTAQRRSQDAYRADRYAADGICVYCETAPRSGMSRACRACKQWRKQHR